jgi:hypothetical protein
MLIRSCLVALGLISAMAIATPTPTLTQGVYIEGPGMGIHFGRRGDRERHYRGDRERHYRGDRSDRSYAYERGRFGGCRTMCPQGKTL